jgi:hypothetical protein
VYKLCTPCLRSSTCIKLNLSTIKKIYVTLEVKPLIDINVQLIYGVLYFRDVPDRRPEVAGYDVRPSVYQQ